MPQAGSLLQTEEEKAIFRKPGRRAEKPTVVGFFMDFSNLARLLRGGEFFGHHLKFGITGHDKSIVSQAASLASTYK